MDAPRPQPDRDPERLVLTYADLILRVCYTYLHVTSDAEDICQDTLVKLLQRQEPFRSTDHERAWVIRVAINACKNLLRERSSHATVPLDAIGEPSTDATADEETLRQRDQWVLRAVMALPLAMREVVYLHYYEGYRTREIAQIVGATDETVRQRLTRARARLRETLKGDYDDFPA